VVSEKEFNAETQRRRDAKEEKKQEKVNSKWFQKRSSTQGKFKVVSEKEFNAETQRRRDAKEEKKQEQVIRKNFF
jgi:hypothetical protein